MCVRLWVGHRALVLRHMQLIHINLVHTCFSASLHHLATTEVMASSSEHSPLVILYLINRITILPLRLTTQLRRDHSRRTQHKPIALARGALIHGRLMVFGLFFFGRADGDRFDCVFYFDFCERLTSSDDVFGSMFPIYAIFFSDFLLLEGVPIPS